MILSDSARRYDCSSVSYSSISGVASSRLSSLDSRLIVCVTSARQIVTRLLMYRSLEAREIALVKSMNLRSFRCPSRSPRESERERDSTYLYELGVDGTYCRFAMNEEITLLAMIYRQFTVKLQEGKKGACSLSCHAVDSMP